MSERGNLFANLAAMSDEEFQALMDRVAPLRSLSAGRLERERDEREPTTVNGSMLAAFMNGFSPDDVYWIRKSVVRAEREAVLSALDDLRAKVEDERPVDNTGDTFDLGYDKACREILALMDDSRSALETPKP